MRATVLLGAVALSGAAALVNQVAWQRALKVFLGGSETTSALVVVLVFLAGLGAGAALASRRVARLHASVRTLAGVELLLAAANVTVCILLAADLSVSVFAVQRVAVDLGLPLRAVYAVAAGLVLGVPCLLMGATTPIAAEACGRALGWRSPRQLGVLFAANTAGSVAGVIVGTAWLLPTLGQTQTLVLAAGANVVAGAALWIVGRRRPTIAPSSPFGGEKGAEGRMRGEPTERQDQPGDRSASRRRGWPGGTSVAPVPVRPPSQGRPPATDDGAGYRPSTPTGRGNHVVPGHDALLAFGLGAASLGYEMYLLRLLPLRHEPLPYTFGAALLGVLLWWSVGAALAATRLRLSVGAGLRLLALALIASVPAWFLDAPHPVHDVGSLVWFALTRAPYFAPFVVQGFLFTRVAARSTNSWGADVGRVYAWNTLGCCVGTAATTLVGYELPIPLLLGVLVLGVVALQVREDTAVTTEGARPRVPWIPLGIAAALVALPTVTDTSRLSLVERTYTGRDGVVEVDAEGNVAWDGLWHSRLSRGEDHVGTRNWLAAAVPWLVHGGDELDVAVLGLSIGVTASTFARSPTVGEVVGYDINHALVRLFRDYPAGTLGVATNPKVDIRWQDARSGLALDARRYDIVQSQPLYLRQAGSGLLNSVEMMRLVASRLAPGGIFCLYSNGTPEQALLLRATAARVFPGRASFSDGYLLLLSNEPLDDLAARVRARYTRPAPTGGDALLDEIRRFPATATADALLAELDTDLSWDAGPLVTTDDRPLVEYPETLAAEVRAHGLQHNLAHVAPAAAFRSGSER